MQPSMRRVSSTRVQVIPNVRGGQNFLNPLHAGWIITGGMGTDASEAKEQIGEDA